MSMAAPIFHLSQTAFFLTLPNSCPSSGESGATTTTFLAFGLVSSHVCFRAVFLNCPHLIQYLRL